MEKPPFESEEASRNEGAVPEATTSKHDVAIQDDAFLTDWDQGLIGWDSQTDPDNPL
jgi:hypothetical protein